MCKAMEEMCNQAAAQAALEKAKTVVFRMLAAGKYTLEEIAEMTEIPLDEVKKLQAGEDA